MLDIVQVDHIGIRVSDRDVSLAFYAQLGFRALHDGGFDQGHPVILQHPSGVVVNLLGPSMAGAARNVLMDEPDKYSGYTHVALRVASLEATQTALAAAGIEITGGPDPLQRPRSRPVHPRSRQHGHRADRERGRGIDLTARLRLRDRPFTGQ